MNEYETIIKLIPRSPRTRLNVEKQGEGREDLMTMKIILLMRLLVMVMFMMTMIITMIMIMLI